MDEKKFTQADAKAQQEAVQAIIDLHLSKPQVSRCILNNRQVLFDDMTAEMNDVKARVAKKFAQIVCETPGETRHRFNHNEDSDYIRVYFG